MLVIGYLLSRASLLADRLADPNPHQALTPPAPTTTHISTGPNPCIFVCCVMPSHAHQYVWSCEYELRELLLTDAQALEVVAVRHQVALHTIPEGTMGGGETGEDEGAGGSELVAGHSADDTR